MLSRKWTQQDHIKQLRIFRHGLCALVTGLVLTIGAGMWNAVPAASAGSTSQAQSSTRVFVVAGTSTTTTFRAKVTGASSSAPTPTGSVAFAINGSDPLQCDGLSTNTVPMTGGVATCRVAPAVPPSGSPVTAEATYSGDENFAASYGTYTADDGNFAPPVPLVVTPPASIPDDCSSDAAPALLSWLSSLPQGTASNPLVVTLPSQACYMVDESVNLRGMTDTTFDGEGASLEEELPLANTQTHPIVSLWQDTNLTVEHLTIDGPYDGSNGGENSEGDYGLDLEGDSGVNLTHLTVSDIQGDFIYLSPPHDLTNISDSLNTNISITHSTFTNAGYHGLTIESANGLTVNDDVFNGMGTDAMDFEYDDYSTGFNPDGTPSWAAEDNITIENSSWTKWGADWFASIQGQLPGVQEQNVTLTGNTLNSDSPLFEIVGTPASVTTAPYLNTYLTITDNKFASGYYAKGWRGGISAASSIQNVSNLFIEDNTFPLCARIYESPQPASDCSAPDAHELDLYGITNGKVLDNNFAGALGIVQPQDFDTDRVGMFLCGNYYGVNAAQLDDSCPSTTS